MTKAGRTLEDVGDSLSWRSLTSFITNEDDTSALARELDIERHLWSKTAMTNSILADIYDMLAQINSVLIAFGSHGKVKRIDPYPRPGAAAERADSKHFGKGALPKKELREWFEQKRRERYGGNG